MNNEKKEEINDSKNEKQSNHKMKNENQSENEDYYINQDDIIKVGEQIYIVSEIFLKNEIVEEKEYKIYDINYLNYNKGLIFDLCSQPKILNEKNYCKHIVNDLKEGKNSKKFEEIKNWMEETKKYKYNRKIIIYRIYLYKCKECKRFYPLRFKLSENSEVIEFIEIEKPKDKNYIILEMLEQMEDIDKEVIKYFFQLN